MTDAPSDKSLPRDLSRNFELRHVRYFIAAAEEEHFGRAAERLFVTRPAVSQIIADLEERLRVSLFERLGHRVKLTAAGRTLLPRFQSIVADLNQAVLSAQRVGEGKSGLLNIGYGTLSLHHPLFRAAIKVLHERHPGVTLSLLEIPTAEQLEAIAAGRIHAGFTHFGPRLGRGGRGRRNGATPAGHGSVLDRFVIQTGSLGIVVRHDHDLARRKSIALADLADERFVVVRRSNVIPGYGPLSYLCQKAGFELNIVQEVGTIATQLNLISVGVGIGLAVTGRHFTYPPDLTIVKLSDVSYRTTFELSWLKGPREPVLDQLIEIVKELAREFA